MNEHVSASAQREVRDFLVPDLGEGLEDATVVAWHVEVGETVELNQPLCTLETAKAEVEVPSPFSGTVVETCGSPGDVLAVGSVLARIALSAPAPGGHPAASATPGLRAAPAPRETAEARAPESTTENTTENTTESTTENIVDPVENTVLVGYGTGGVAHTGEGRSRPRRPAPSRTGGRRAAEAAARTAGPLAEADRAAGERVGAGQEPGTGPGIPSGVDIPLSAVRARIAAHLGEAHRGIPAAVAVRTLDCAALGELRPRVDDEAERRGHGRVVTPFALLAWAATRAVAAHPILNSTFDARAAVIHQHRGVHLGVAVATERGLLTPVIRNAERLGIIEFAVELRRIGDGARRGDLPPIEMVGSTFTVTNFGVFGLESGVPIINSPEAAVLGVGSIEDRAVAAGGRIEARPTCSLTCVFDHRVCDGAQVGEFLATLAGLVEDPSRAVW